jgi:hypothetical protein
MAAGQEGYYNAHYFDLEVDEKEKGQRGEGQNVRGEGDGRVKALGRDQAGVSDVPKRVLPLRGE